MRWRLLNGEARNAESPDTFERMWVKVEQALLGGYRGVLDNKPLHDGSLKLGAKVEFRPEHVISIHDSTH